MNDGTPVLVAQGECPCCLQQVEFRSDDEWLRDNFRCPECASIPRERALMAVLDRVAPGWPDLAIHESSPGQHGASLRLARECERYQKSQFFPGRALAETVGEFRNEDLERQTFRSGSFDIVISQDVMEHVLDPATAFGEIARTLKPGGMHVFTTPLVNGSRPSEQTARRGQDGEIVHLSEPEYHDNPVDPEGSLVTMRWGFDIGEFIFAASGMVTTVFSLDDLSRGIRAELNEVLVSRKPARKALFSRKPGQARRRRTPWARRRRSA